MQSLTDHMPSQRPIIITDGNVGRYYADALPDFSPQAEAQLRAGLLDISRQLAQAPANMEESEAERLNREILEVTSSDSWRQQVMELLGREP